MGIQICSNEGPRPFPRGDNKELAKIHWQTLKIYFLRTTGPISTKLGTMHPWVKGNQVCSNEGSLPFLRGDNNEIAKTHWRTLKILFSRTIWLILTKLGTKHSWVKEIQDYWNEGPRPFPRGDNSEIAKIHWRTLKILFSIITGPIFTKLGTFHSLLKGIQVCSNEGPRPFSRGGNI